MPASVSASTLGQVLSPPGAAAFEAALPTLNPRWSRRVAIDLVALCDVLCVIAGGTLPAAIYSIYGGLRLDWLVVIHSSLVAAGLTALILRAMGHYDPTRLHDLAQSPARLLASLLMALIGTFGLGLPHVIQSTHLLVWYATWASAGFTLLLASRSIAHLVLRRLTAEGRFDERVAVYGAGGIARRVHNHLSGPDAGIAFVGVYDDRAGEDRINPEGLSVKGGAADLIADAREGLIDRIIIALPASADRRINQIAAKLSVLPVSLHVVTHLATDLVDRSPAHRVSNIGSVGLIDVKKKPLSDWAPFIKRTEDYTLGAVLLILAVPLLPLIALAIRLDSAGPVLFRQRRRGLNLRTIDVLKFRTMTVMEDGSEVRQVAKGDPRVTRVGRLLRATSLDELPQLVNVLRGEMSLVGPRPHALVHDEHYGQLLENYANRHQVKPGITGLAQVNGLRGETATTDSMRKRVDLDIAYIANWSLWLDLRIVARTVWAMLNRRNAH